MRKRLLAGLAGFAILAAVPAGAADLGIVPPPAPMAVAPTFTWTGWYVGANAGGGWKTGSVDRTCVAPGGALFGGACSLIPRIDEHSGGFIAGGQIGYNWQAGPWVLGLETDFDGSGIRGRDTLRGPFDTAVGGVTAPGSFFRATEHLDWFGTTRARVGFTPAERLLIYGTAGVAYGGVRTTALFGDGVGGTAFATRSGPRAGWAAGGGVEYALTNNVSVRAEALFFDLGATSTQGTSLDPAGAPNGYVSGGSFRNQGALVRGAVNIKSDGLFGWRLW